MDKPKPSDRKWNQRSNASPPEAGEADAMFRLLFERSADAISLLDPAIGRFIASNDAVARLTGAPNTEALGQASPAEISPERQPDNRLSSEKAAEMVQLALAHGSHRFEWLTRRHDGTDLWLDVVLTAVSFGGRPLLLTVAREITQQKRAEEEIRRLNATLEQRVAERTLELTASEARLRTLVENAPEAIVVFDGQSGRFQLVNENAVRLFGRAREELLQLTPADVSPPFQPDGRPSAEVAREKIHEALGGGMPVFEWLHRHPSGRLFTSEVRLVRLPAEGQPLVRASIIDNTQQHRQQETQRAIYELSEAVHTAADLPSLYARIHGIVRSLMPADNFFIALYDASTQMISFPYYVDEYSTEVPQPRKVSTGLTGAVLRTGKPFLADAHLPERSRRAGQAVVVDELGGVAYLESGRPAAVWLGVPLLIQGQPIGVMAVQDYHDPGAYGEQEKQILAFVAGQTALAIERKRGEEALRESAEKHRALFEASSQGVMLHDEKQFLEVNPAAVRILGLRCAEEVIGHHPSEFADPIQADGRPADVLANERIAECLERGSTRFEWMCVSPDGRKIPLDVLLTRVAWKGRWIIQAVVDDITERKNAEAELLKALAREKELGQLRSNFVSMVSHEFRTPLGVIQSSAEILEDYHDQLEPAERREQLQSISKNTRRMAALMEEVLLIGRLDAGKMDFRPAPLELHSYAPRLVEDVLSATDNRCPIQLSLGPLPPEGRADERLLRHILVNLLTNAAKYSDPGVPVRLSIERDGPDAVCVVRDRGIGIPPGDLEWVFHAFHRARNVGDRPGTGLGLVIVKRCVDLHGGRLKVESTLGEGTTMTVRLPLFAQHESYEKDSGH